MAAVCHAVHRAAETLGQLQAAFGGDGAVVIADDMVNLRRHRAQRRMVDAGAVGVGVHVEITDDGQGGQGPSNPETRNIPPICAGRAALKKCSSEIVPRLWAT